MGIDLKAGGRVKTRGRTEVKCDNPYLKLLVKMYKFLARRTDSKFNKVIANRLCMTGVQKAPMSISKLGELMKGKEEKTAVVVGPITDDVRLFEVGKMSVCALKFTESARARIVAAGGECLTFDQLALRAPKGQGCVLLRGAVKARKTNRHFGRAPGVPGGKARPYLGNRGSSLKRKSRKFEQARGRRRSRGFKV